MQPQKSGEGKIPRWGISSQIKCHLGSDIHAETAVGLE